MHPTSRPGAPPYDFGDPSDWPPHLRPGPAGPSAAPAAPAPTQEAHGLGGLRRRLGAVDRGLITVNAGCFAVLVVLAGAAPGLLAVDVVGRVNLGLLLCVALGVVSLFTSVRYDRRCSREIDPEAHRIRVRHEERVAAAAAAAERRDAGRRWSGW